MADAPRGRDGRLLPGAKLNPGGRPRSRVKAFAESVMADTDDLATLRKLLLSMAGDPDHPDQYKAIKELLMRTLGAYPALPVLGDDQDAEELTDDQLLELAEKFVAEVKARRTKEKTDGGAQEAGPEAAGAGEQPGPAAGGLPAEVGEVPEAGALPVEEPERDR